MLKGSNICYEMAVRVQAVPCGGIGAMLLMAQQLGLVEDSEQRRHFSLPVRPANVTKAGHKALERYPCFHESSSFPYVAPPRGG